MTFEDISPTPPDAARDVKKSDPIEVAADTYYEPRFCDRIKYLATEMKFVEGWAYDIGVSEMTMYDWIEKFPEFKEAYNIAVTTLRSTFTDEIVSAARGEKPGANAVLYVLLAKKRFKDLYGDPERFPTAPIPLGITPQAIEGGMVIDGKVIDEMAEEQLIEELKMLRERHGM